MENFSLFGIPFPLIGFFCFLLAALFIFIWPKSKAKGLTTLTFPKFILHYFHPLAWVLLGMAAFFQKNSTELALVLAGGGIFVFIVFVFVFFRS
ncbi:MAG: hypothetical protein WCK35_11775 [Chloroflexota bacterium]|jgi:hypothetical protein